MMKKTGLSNIETSESKFQKKVLMFLRKIVGGHWIKIHASSYQLEGEPDIVGCFEGQFFAFELKQGNYQPTALQLYKIERINEAGGIAIVARSIEDIEEALSRGSSYIPQFSKSL